MTSGGNRESEQVRIVANGCCPCETRIRCSGSCAGCTIFASTKRALPSINCFSAASGSLIVGRAVSVGMTTSAGTVTVVVAGATCDRPDPHPASTVADAATPAAPNHSRLDTYLLIDGRLP